MDLNGLETPAGYTSGLQTIPIRRYLKPKSVNIRDVIFENGLRTTIRFLNYRTLKLLCAIQVPHVDVTRTVTRLSIVHELIRYTSLELITILRYKLQPIDGDGDVPYPWSSPYNYF